MFTTNTISAPASVSTARKVSLVAWVAVGLFVATMAVAVAIALWPESEADKARNDGKQLGEAVGRLYNAQSSADVDAALADIQAVAADTRDHASDAVASQVDAQADALSRAVDGFVGSNTSTSDVDVAVYQTELDVALDDLTGQADQFRSQGPEVQQAYWDGFQDGLPGD